MKKNYQKPTTSVDDVQLSEIICDSVRSIEGGTVKYGGSSVNNTSGQIRSRGTIVWDDGDE